MITVHVRVFRCVGLLDNGSSGGGGGGGRLTGGLNDDTMSVSLENERLKNEVYELRRLLAMQETHIQPTESSRDDVILQLHEDLDGAERVEALEKEIIHAKGALDGKRVFFSFFFFFFQRIEAYISPCKPLHSTSSSVQYRPTNLRSHFKRSGVADDASARYVNVASFIRLQPGQNVYP